MAAVVAGQDLRIAVSRNLAPPLANRILAELSPGPGMDSDEGLAAFVLANCITIFHPFGTCRMGTDDHAVVDSPLRVHGIDKPRCRNR